MTLRHPDGPRWLLRGLGGGPEAGGVFVHSKVAALEKADIDRGIFPRSLKIWGRPAEGFGRLLDSTKLVITPSHDGTGERLLRVSHNLHCGLREASNTHAGSCHESVLIGREGTAKSYLDEWRESCIAGAQEDYPANLDSGGSKNGGIPPIYDQATAGSSSPGYGEAVGDSYSRLRSNNMRRRDSMQGLRYMMAYD